MSRPASWKSARRRIAFGAAVLWLAPADAQAYIDPGAGLLAIQGLLAAIGAIIVFVKNPVQGVKRLCARLFARFGQRNQ